MTFTPAPLDWSVLGPPAEPGVYFGMSNEDYRAAGAASASLFKDIAVSPLTAWVRHVNPTREDETTEAQDVGTAYHKLILEGVDAFNESCAVLPENDGEYLDGATELKARCAELGIKKGGTIAEMCARILEKDPEAKLWPVRMREFKNEHEGKILLKPSVYQEIAVPAKFIRSHPFAGKAFEGGYPEVSVFWTDNGMPCKARLDYLKTKAVIDLKSFANMNDLPINRAVARAIATESHHVQARHYLDAVRAAKKHVKAGLVYGMGEENRAWLSAFAAAPEHVFIWVFIQKGNVPEIRIVEFRQSASEGASDNAYWSDAEQKIEDAKSLVKTCIETYGSSPWVAPEPMLTLQDAGGRNGVNFPLWALE